MIAGGWARPVAAAITLLTATVGALAAGFWLLPEPEVRIAGFATSLAGRTPAQRHNAALAADALDGRVVLPGGTLSFNRSVGSWSADRGYRKAPVSYDGELVPAFGGGVCQTSTTLYNAALRAGMGVKERHHHVFAPHYCAPGSDAAVAFPTIDLRLVNPYPFSLRLRAAADGDQLRVEIWGKKQPALAAEVEPRILTVTHPDRITRVTDASPRAGSGRNPGMTGYRVVTYRLFTRNGKQVKRERLSDDSYPVMNRVVALTTDPMPAL